MPTIQQLQQLLEAVNRKIGNSGFSSVLDGWQTWAKTVVPAEVHGCRPALADWKGLNGILKALSSLDRIGEAEHVEISAFWRLVPWLIALIKWCTGQPPAVRVGSNEEVLLPSAGSRVTLIAWCSGPKPTLANAEFSGIEVTTYKSFKFKTLLTREHADGIGAAVHTGLTIPIRTFLKRKLDDFNETQKAFSEGPFTIIGVLFYIFENFTDMLVSTDSQRGQRSTFDLKGHDRPVSDFCRPLPTSRSLEAILDEVFSLKMRVGGSLKSHKQFRTVLQRIETGLQPDYEYQMLHLFVQIILASLLISSISDLDEVHVVLDDGFYNLMNPLNELCNGLSSIFHHSFRDGAFGLVIAPHNFGDLVRAALSRMMGTHEYVARDDSHTLALSQRCQTMWPKYFEGADPCQVGTLSFSVFHGSLLFEGQPYTRITGRGPRIPPGPDVPETLPLNARQMSDGSETLPFAHADSLTVSRMIAIASEDTLHMGEHCGGWICDYRIASYQSTCENLLFVPQCLPNCAKARNPEIKVIYCSHWDEALEIETEQEKIKVWPCHGSLELRRSAVAIFGGDRRRLIFVHTGSCLSCICQRASEYMRMFPKIKDTLIIC